MDSWTYEEKRKMLKNISAFNEANEASLDTLANTCNIRYYEKGEYVFEDKEKCANLYAVIDGLVSLYKMNVQGEKKVIFILGKGKIINEFETQDLPASVSCDVFESAQIVYWNKSEFLDMMSRDFGLTKGILHSLSLKTRRLYRQLKNTSNSVKGDKRIAAKLWKLSGDYGVPCEKGTCIDLELSITYLADMLGSQRETVSRQIKTLKEERLITVEDKKFIVYDRDNLANYFKRT